MTLIFTDDEQSLFNQIIKEYQLNDHSSMQLKHYIQELVAWNELMDLTAVTEIKNILSYHIQDSLAIIKFIDFSKIIMIADIGSGAGLPGIPLKIARPELNVILIEVTKKRIEFLAHVINILNLENIDIYPNDWRTFLRKTDFAIDIFCARASLQPEELFRMFKPSCVYNKSQLIYWASSQWKPDESELLYLKNQVFYTIKSRRRQFAFFEKK